MNASRQNESAAMFIHCADSFHTHICVRPCPAVLHTFDLTEIFKEYSRF